MLAVIAVHFSRVCSGNFTFCSCEAATHWQHKIRQAITDTFWLVLVLMFDMAPTHCDAQLTRCVSFPSSSCLPVVVCICGPRTFSLNLHSESRGCHANLHLPSSPLIQNCCIFCSINEWQLTFALLCTFHLNTCADFDYIFIFTSLLKRVMQDDLRCF